MKKTLLLCIGGLGITSILVYKILKLIEENKYYIDYMKVGDNYDFFEGLY